MHNGRLLLSPLPTTTPEPSSSSSSAGAGVGAGAASTPLSEPLHELDLVLLSSVERAKTAHAGIAALVTSTTSTTTDDKTMTKTEKGEGEDAAADMYVVCFRRTLSTHTINHSVNISYHATSPPSHHFLSPPLPPSLPPPPPPRALPSRCCRYVGMLSFCGRYGSGGGRRFDVPGALASVGLAVNKDDASAAASPGTDAGDVDEAAGAGAGVLGSRARPGTSLVFDVFAPDQGLVQGQDDSGEGGQGQGLLSVVVVVDPLSLAGQRAASVISLLQQHLRLPLTVVLLPSPHLRDFPLQNFYRYVANPYSPKPPGPPALPNEPTPALAPVQLATFHALPRANIFTLRVDAPEPWNIQVDA